MSKLNQFINENRNDLLNHLSELVEDLKREMRINPRDFTEVGCDEPSIDVRLCIDFSRRGKGEWIVRVGSSDFDPYHSEFCSSGSIGLEADVESLLNDLIGGLNE